MVTVVLFGESCTAASVVVRMIVNDLDSLSSSRSSKITIAIHCFIVVALKVNISSRMLVKSLPSEKLVEIRIIKQQYVNEALLINCYTNYVISATSCCFFLYKNGVKCRIISQWVTYTGFIHADSTMHGDYLQKTYILLT